MEQRHCSALVAVTLSQRGSPKLYQHDLVDSLVLLVRFLASTHGFDSPVLSVCSYKISAPMYTVAFLIAPSRDTTSHTLLPHPFPAQHAAFGEVWKDGGGGDGQEGKLAGVRAPEGKNLVFFPGEWNILQGVCTLLFYSLVFVELWIRVASWIHEYSVAKTHSIPYLYRSFSAKEPYI